MPESHKRHYIMSELIRVGITHGDINGVGYEVILKALADPMITDLFTPVIYGMTDVAEKCREMLQLNDMQIHIAKDTSEIKDGRINLIPVAEGETLVQPGIIDKEAGRLAVKSLEKAVESLKDGDIDVLVTAPISKESVQSEEFNFPGHTEFLEASLGEGEKAMMILCNRDMRVALLTIHIPLAEVAQSVTVDNIKSSVAILADSLKKDFGIVRPTIAVLSLNPHAGDGGVIGKEEEEVIKPAIQDLNDEGILAFGPYPADGFFGHGSFHKFDGILAMYHDQGLAPFKSLASGNGVNFTAGLPYVRTSPDHGTAFDIAWQGKADETSLREAIYLAIDIFRKREIFDEASANPLKKYITEKPDRGERQEKSGATKQPLTEETDD